MKLDTFDSERTHHAFPLRHDLTLEAEHDVANRRLGSGNGLYPDLLLGDRVLVEQAILEDDAHVVLPGHERKDVLEGQREGSSLLKLTRCELQEDLTVLGDDELTTALSRLDADVRGRVVAGLVLVRLQVEILGIDLDAEVDERSVLGSSENGEKCPIRKVIEGVIGGHSVAVTNKRVQIIRGNGSFGSVVDTGEENIAAPRGLCRNKSGGSLGSNDRDARDSSLETWSMRVSDLLLSQPGCPTMSACGPSTDGW